MTLRPILLVGERRRATGCAVSQVAAQADPGVLGPRIRWTP